MVRRTLMTEQSKGVPSPESADAAKQAAERIAAMAAGVAAGTGVGGGVGGGGGSPGSLSSSPYPRDPSARSWLSLFLSTVTVHHAIGVCSFVPGTRQFNQTMLV